MTPLMVSLLASGAKITIHGLPMFVSIIETVIVPVAIGFVLNYALGKNKTFKELQKVMPGVAVLGLACVVGGVISSQGSKFFQSGAVIFIAVLLHNGLGYFLGYCAGRLTGMNTAKKRTISIEVGMQNAGLATNHNCTVCFYTRIRNHLCCFLCMAFYFRNITGRIICPV